MTDLKKPNQYTTKRSKNQLIVAIHDLLTACKWVAQEIYWSHDMRASLIVLEQVIKKYERSITDDRHH